MALVVAAVVLACRGDDDGKESGELGVDSGEVLEPWEGVEECTTITSLVAGEEGETAPAPPGIEWEDGGVGGTAC